MSLVRKLKHMAMSPDKRIEAVRGLLRDRCVELARANSVVVSSGIDEELVRSGGNTGLPAWVIYYDADPDLQGFMILEIDSFHSGEGMVSEHAHANLFQEDQPRPHVLIADLLVFEQGRRHHTIGTRLVEAAKTIASQRGVPLIGNLSDVDDVARLVGFYQRMGFETQIYEDTNADFAGQIRWAPPTSAAEST